MIFLLIYDSFEALIAFGNLDSSIDCCRQIFCIIFMLGLKLVLLTGYKPT